MSQVGYQQNWSLWQQLGKAATGKMDPLMLQKLDVDRFPNPALMSPAKPLFPLITQKFFSFKVYQTMQQPKTFNAAYVSIEQTYKGWIKSTLSLKERKKESTYQLHAFEPM
jgi:hypothetical protein